MYSDYKNLSTIDFAQNIRLRPSMFFGKEIKLSQLENMLWGFNLNSQKESKIPFQYFNYWVKKKLNKFGAIYNWAVAIIESCEGSDEKAFWKFYELLDEFLALKPRSLFVTELSSDNFSFYYSSENKNKNHRIIGKDNRYILEPAPYHIKVFEFDYCVHSYHFDYYWLVDEYGYNLYYQHYDSLLNLKDSYKKKFGVIDWTKIDDSETQDTFDNTINHCRNRRRNII